jgi:hypothetical protein
MPSPFPALPYLSLNPGYTVSPAAERAAAGWSLPVWRASKLDRQLVSFPAAIVGEGDGRFRWNFFDVAGERFLGTNDPEIWAQLAPDENEAGDGLRRLLEYLDANADSFALPPEPTPPGPDPHSSPAIPSTHGDARTRSARAKKRSALSVEAVEFTLSADQLRALKIAKGLDPQIVLITGAAGTGKSVLVNRLREDPHTLVVAPTGMAALSIEGATIHRAFDIPVGLLEQGLHLKAPRQDVKEILLATRRVVIDEISMARADLIDAVDARLREVHDIDEPFGGLKVVLVGDPYQLAPVAKPDELEHLERLGYRSTWFFSALVFRNFPILHVELTTIHRQRSDLPFYEILSRLRKGDIRDEDLTILNQRIVDDDTAVENTAVLCTTNAAADTINGERLESLEGWRGVFPAVRSDWRGKQLPADDLLIVRKEARVMFLKNDPIGLWANGTQGVIKGWDEDALTVRLDSGSTCTVERTEWKQVEPAIDEEDESITYVEKGSFKQFPVRLAWAVTIHKSQGQTMDSVLVDLGRGSFAPGQTYVALSRCRKLSSLHLRTPVRHGDIKADSLVGTYLKWLESKADVVRRRPPRPARTARTARPSAPRAKAPPSSRGKPKGSVRLVGSSSNLKSDPIYHRHDCEWARKIGAENEILLADARQAQLMGYRPCKWCL